MDLGAIITPLSIDLAVKIIASCYGCSIRTCQAHMGTWSGTRMFIVWLMSSGVYWSNCFTFVLVPVCCWPRLQWEDFFIRPRGCESVMHNLFVENGLCQVFREDPSMPVNFAGKFSTIRSSSTHCFPTKLNRIPFYRQTTATSQCRYFLHSLRAKIEAPVR